MTCKLRAIARLCFMITRLRANHVDLGSAESFSLNWRGHLWGCLETSPKLRYHEPSGRQWTHIPHHIYLSTKTSMRRIPSLWFTTGRPGAAWHRFSNARLIRLLCKFLFINERPRVRRPGIPHFCLLNANQPQSLSHRSLRRVRSP